MNNADLIRQLYGWGSLPTQSSNTGQYGSYDLQGLTADQLGDLLQYNRQGFVPLEGTNGGVSVYGGPTGTWLDTVDENAQHNAPTQPTYQLRYTPNFSGSRTAENQDIAQEDQGSAYLQALGMAITGAGLGGAFSGADTLANGGTWAQAVDAAKANSLWSALGGTGTGTTGQDLFSGLGDTTADINAGNPDLFSGLGDTTADLAGNTDITADAASLPTSSNTYYNPVTGETLPYGEVGSVGEPGFMSAEVPWYEKLATSFVDNPGAATKLGGALYSLFADPTQGGGASGGGMPNLGGLGGSGGGVGGSGGMSGGVANSASVTPQQLGLPQFTKFDNPLGVEYKGLDMMNPYAQALRSY